MIDAQSTNIPPNFGLMASVVTFPGSQWKENAELLRKNFAGAGALVRTIEEDRNLQESSLRLFFIGLLNELRGPHILWVSFHKGLRLSALLRLYLGSIANCAFRIAHAFSHPKSFVRLSRKHVSLTSKHIHALQIFLSEPAAKVALVLEDDALLSNEEWLALLKTAEFVGAQTGPVVVNACPTHQISMNLYDSEAATLRPSLSFFDTTAAYFMNRAAAQGVLGMFDIHRSLRFLSADWAMTLASNPGFKFYTKSGFMNGSLLVGESSLGTPSPAPRKSEDQGDSKNKNPGVHK